MPLNTGGLIKSYSVKLRKKDETKGKAVKTISPMI
mgnify:CR=1 FL=1